ncbi:MAG TPA: cache domain-containing protein [Acidobacteriota bacterium]|nr:cache domain-containing protein [Acidobacteriota bacterium]
MAESERSRFDLRILVLFLILGMVPLIVGALLLMSSARTIYQESIEEHLVETAEFTQSLISTHLQQRIIDVAGITAIPTIRERVREANQTLLPVDQLRDHVDEVETQWGTLIAPSQSVLLAEILENEASAYLRDYQSFDSSMREILVTDQQARLIAATNKTSDYFQGDEQWWYDCYRDGKGGHYISDMRYDESAQVFAIEIAQPVVDPATKEAIGVVKAIVDSQDIFALVNSTRVGEKGLAFLVRGDGMVLNRTAGAHGELESYPNFEDVMAALQENRNIVEARREEGRFLVGASNRRFSLTFPNLDWLVVVEQPYSEAYAPFQDVTSRYIYIILFSLVVVVALSLIFTWLLRKPVIEVDPHLERI